MDRLVSYDFLKKAFRPFYDDNAVDRLHNVYTVGFHVISAGVILTYTLAGNPIRCWAPAQFSDSWNEYIVDYCFVENTYFLMWSENIPQQQSDRGDREIQYYQWVPFFLVLMALVFYIPRYVWKTFNSKTGIKIKNIIKMSMKWENVKTGERAKCVENVAKHLQEALQFQKDFRVKGNILMSVVQCGKREGIYLTLLYLVVKLLYLLNVVGQFFLLNRFLGPEYKWWGFGILKDLVNGVEWQHSGSFPRTTLCDFDNRQIGQSHTWTVQCVLWINMFNEKIFIFLWWWYFVVLLITACDLIKWLIIFILGKKAEQSFILKYLRVNKGFDEQDEQKLHEFIDKRLRPDGVFVLRLILANSGILVTTGIITKLWEMFLLEKENEKKQAAVLNSNENTSKKPNGSSKSTSSDEFREIDEMPLIDRSRPSSTRKLPLGEPEEIQPFDRSRPPSYRQVPQAPHYIEP